MIESITSLLNLVQNTLHSVQLAVIVLTIIAFPAALYLAVKNEHKG